MQIRTATQADYPNVMAFYDAMNAEIGRQAFLHIQYRGGFPPNDMVVSAIDNRELFVGEEDGRIVAAYIMNSEADAAYNTVQWQIVAPKDQVCILHHVVHRQTQDQSSKIFELHDNGLSNRKIASELSIPAGTVSAFLSRRKKRLAFLQDHPEGSLC